MTSVGVPSSVVDDVIILPWNDLEESRRIILENRQDLAAIIAEATHCFPPKEGFLAGLREITEKEDILLVFDEVKTGFRLAFGGAQERFGVKATSLRMPKPWLMGFL